MFDEKMQNIVVVGASHAGISFIDNIRKSGFGGSITLVDRQKGGPMERPPLSKQFLLETEDKLDPIFLLKRAKWYKDNDIILKLGVEALEINLGADLLTLSNGDSLTFDKLILATGARPRFLPGCDNLVNAFVLRQPDDAIAIRETARKARSAVIIGGGYIGLEVAASFRQMGLEVCVIEAAERLLARVASPPVANFLLNLHQKHGVSIYTGVSVEELVKDQEKFTAAKLSDGSIIEGDMLVIGIGVTPDSFLAHKAGLETERSDGGAIIVDGSMQTSNPSIIAIGDVALRSGENLRIESVHNAQEHAAHAVAGMMGHEPPVDEAPRFWSDQYDANLQSVGIVPVDANDVFQVVRHGTQEESSSYWSFQDKTLLSVEAIRDVENFMLGTKCLDQHFSPDPDLIGDPEFDPLA